MSLKSTAKSAVRVAKANPEIALMLAGLLAPKLVAKAAPKIVQAVAIAKAVKGT